MLRSSLARRARPLLTRPAHQSLLRNRAYDSVPASIIQASPCSHHTSVLRAHCSAPIAGALHTTLGPIQSPVQTGSPTDEIERLPLPPGVSGDKFGVYEIRGSSKDWNKVSGLDALVCVHGPEELWVPEGTKNEGAGGGVFAVVAAGGSQHKVIPGDVLYTVRRPGEVNERIELSDVLVIGAYDWTIFGRPLIRNATVTATIEEQTLSGKVIVAKFKKRKGYRRRQGHRQPITRMRIEEVNYEFPEAEKIVPHQMKYDPRRPPQPNHARWF